MQSNKNPLVQLLDAVADEVEQMAGALNDVMWNAFVETEQRTVGQLFDHIAWAWIAESAAFRAIARGAGGSGMTEEWLDAENAKQTLLSAERTRVEILARLRNARTLAAGFVSSLTPEQLERRGTHMPGEPERSVAEWIEVCLIGHPREHMLEIETTIANQPS